MTAICTLAYIHAQCFILSLCAYQWEGSVVPLTPNFSFSATLPIRLELPGFCEDSSINVVIQLLSLDKRMLILNNNLIVFFKEKFESFSDCVALGVFRAEIHSCEEFLFERDFLRTQNAFALLANIIFVFFAFLAKLLKIANSLCKLYKFCKNEGIAKETHCHNPPFVLCPTLVLLQNYYSLKPHKSG